MSRVARITISSMAAVLFASAAWATPITPGRTETRTDYVSAGVGGIGDGPGTISISGVKGFVRKAFLYWQGINNSGTGAIYDNATVKFAGQPVTGTSLGDAETNCWGAGSSRAFVADVSSLVHTNGNYTISDLNAGAGYNGNGASLVVLFDDGNPDNDRDLVFFEGNDSDFIQFGTPPGDFNGWAATLDNINFTGGQAFAQIHASDGQFFTDGTISFTGAANVDFFDAVGLWDGTSVPNAGFSRAGGDSLWDIHTFDITGAFGTPGKQTINFSGMNPTGDCHSLVALMLDLSAGSAPCGNGSLDSGEECDPASSVTTDCSGVRTCLGDCSCGCTSDFQCNDGNGCTADVCNTRTGACEHSSTCPTGPGCGDTCNESENACRTCGHPFSNARCIVNAVFVLQGALDLHPCELCVCDVDSSQSVTVTDALKILRQCTGLPGEIQCSVPTTTTTTTIIP